MSDGETEANKMMEQYRYDPKKDPAHDPKVLRAGIERIREFATGEVKIRVGVVDLCTRLLAGEAIESPSPKREEGGER